MPASVHRSPVLCWGSSNGCRLIHGSIRATAQRLEELPDCGVHLVLLSGHQAAHRSGIAGSTLADVEALVAASSASHPAACVQVWRLRAALVAQPAGWVVQMDAPGSTRLLQRPLSEAVHRPRESVQAWFERLREPVDSYDEDLVRMELEGL